MKKITSYTLVSSANAMEIPKAVEAKMKEGWELYGSPFVSQNAFHQAMVKSEIKNPGGW